MTTALMPITSLKITVHA